MRNDLIDELETLSEEDRHEITKLLLDKLGSDRAYILAVMPKRDSLGTLTHGMEVITPITNRDQAVAAMGAITEMLKTPPTSTVIERPADRRFMN